MEKDELHKEFMRGYRMGKKEGLNYAGWSTSCLGMFLLCVSPGYFFACYIGVGIYFAIKYFKSEESWDQKIIPRIASAILRGLLWILYIWSELKKGTEEEAWSENNGNESKAERMANF